jgi:hypothetical protein
MNRVTMGAGDGQKRTLGDRVSPAAAFIDGLIRVRRAPWLVIGLWLSTLLLALPAALGLHAALGEHLGNSLAAQAAAEGVNFDWWNEFLAQSSGVGRTFVPAILGFAVVIQNLSGIADATGPPSPVVWVVAAQLILSTFLIGGIIDRLARDRTIGAGAFFAACGVYAGRFLRLGVMVVAVYAVLFITVHGWLFDRLYPWLIEDLTVERTAFGYRMALYGMFAVLVLFANLVFDYAKVRAVVEDRRSMLGALSAGFRFVRRNAGAVAGLYALNSGAFLLVLFLYYLSAPGAGANALAFAAGQVFIVLRVIIRLQFAASQTSLFQGRLAHAGYVARPIATWPDSPAAEAIGPS